METNASIEDKAKFFAQYWGQDIFLDSLGLNVSGLEIFRPEFINGIYAKLKPLSQITDEDAVEYLNSIGVDENEFRISQAKIDLSDDYEDNFKLDYLRSKGYALPWMGYSVEQQIELGWIKLEN